MATRWSLPAVSLAWALGVCLAAPPLVHAQAARSAPAARDPFPNACVDCHVAGKDGDMRLSTLVAAWATAVPPALVEKAKAASADPTKVKGKHPAVPNAKTNTPQSCLTCHRRGSTIGPPFAQLMHSIHLVGPTRFLTVHKGECTFCHKLDVKTGAWKLPSGAEK
jgi:hypothetical protein